MRNLFSRPGRFMLVGGILSAALAAAAPAGAAASPGAVFTQDNAPTGNAVQMFARAADGTLSAGRSFATGGAGLASLGGRQGAVELSDDEAYVYAVNAGSNTVTTFRVLRDGLENLGSVTSGGVTPTSIDERSGRVYVLNSGATPNVTTFASGPDGTSPRSPAARASFPARRAPRRSQLRPTARRWSSASACPIAWKRCRWTPPAVPVRR